MIKLRQAIVVEGKYDKNALRQLVDAPVFETNGFGVMKNRELVELLRLTARRRGLIVLTDSDGAGFVIRNYLRGILSEGTVYHAYLPDLYGKEKRKAHASKEGKLGVEGVPEEVILEAVRKSGALDKTPRPHGGITRAELYALGLSGGKDSAARRTLLLKALDLPQRLSGKALLQVLNCVTDLEALQTLARRLWGEEAEK